MRFHCFFEQSGTFKNEFKPQIEQLFIMAKSFAEVGRNVGYSDNGLYNKVRRYIEKL